MSGFDEDELRRLWEVTIPQADWSGLDPGATFRPPPLPSEGSPSGTFALPAFQVSGDAALPETVMPESDPGSAPTEDPLHAMTMAEPPPPGSQPGQAAPPRTGRLAADGGEALFELREVIGKGGMGIVYRAEQRSLAREVAIKKVRTGGRDSRWQERFLAESVVTARLDHPNIVPVYDLGQSAEGELLLAMKLVDGVSWQRLLHPKDEADRARAAGLDLADHLRTLISVCHAVAFAHSRGLIHNDLKPENVMLGEFGEVLVMDWGLAVDVRDDPPPGSPVQHKSAVRAPCGTPSYMPPELARGRGAELGPWTDVYLVGAILFELLTGKAPHAGLSFAEVIFRAGRAEAPPPLPSEAPGELADVCRRALEPLPGKRYPDVVEFREALEAFLQHRESHHVTRAARQQLSRCRDEARSSDPGDEVRRNRLYHEFAGAVAGFAQARLLWAENQEAARGEVEARLDYAEAALRRGDLGLAEAQLSEVPGEEPRRARLAVEIQAERDRRLAAQRAAARTRRSLAASLAALVVGLVVGLSLLERARQTAVRAEGQERLARGEADQRRLEAEAARRESERRLVGSLLAQGEMLLGAERYGPAAASYREARALLGGADHAAALGLVRVEQGARGELLRIAAHRGPARAVALAPDGWTAASGGDDGAVRLWDLRSGRELPGPAPGSSVVRALAFRPRGGGELAVATADGAVTLWTGAGAPRLLGRHAGPVHALDFTPDGAWLFSAGADRLVRRWSLEAPPDAPPPPALEGHPGEVTGLAVTPSGNYAYSGDDTGAVRCWNASGSLNWAFREGAPAPILDLAFSVEEAVFALALTDRSLRLWTWHRELNNFAEDAVLRGHAAPLTAVRFVPGGKTLVSCDREGQVVAWDLAQRAPVRRARPRGGQGEALAALGVCVSWDGARILTAGADGALRLYDLGLAPWVPSGAEEDPALLRLPPDLEGESAALSPDGLLAAAGTRQGPVVVWELGAGRPVLTLLGHAAPVRRVAFLPEGRLLSASEDGTVRLWSLSPEGLPLASREGAPGAFPALGTRPGPAELALADAQGHVWRCRPEELGAPPPAGAATLPAAPRVVALGPAGELLSGDDRGEVRLDGRPLPAMHQAPVTALAVAGRWLASADARGRVALAELGGAGSAPRLLAGGDSEAAVTGLALALDEAGGPLLVFTSDVAGVWRVRQPDGRELASFSDADPGRGVRGLAWDPTRRRLLLARPEGARLFDLERPGRGERLLQAVEEGRAGLTATPPAPAALARWGEWLAWCGSARPAVEALDAARAAGGEVDPLLRMREHWRLGQHHAALAALSEAAGPDAHVALCRASLEAAAAQGDLLGIEPDYVRSLVFSPDGARLLVGVDNGVLDEWDVASGAFRRRLARQAAAVHAMAWAASGRLALGDSQGTLTVLDADSGRVLWRRERAHAERIDVVTFLPDGRLLSGGADKRAALWPADGGEPLLELSGHDAGVRSLALLADGRLATGDGRGELRLWDLERAAPLGHWRADRSGIEGLAATAAGTRLVTAGWSQELTVWDLDGQALVQLPGHEDTIYGMAATGDRAVSADAGGVVRLWDLEAGRSLGQAQRGVIHLCAAISPDGRAWAVGSKDGGVVLGWFPD